MRRHMVGVHLSTWSLSIGYCNGYVKFEFMIHEWSVCLYFKGYFIIYFNLYHINLFFLLVMRGKLNQSLTKTNII